MRHYRDDVNGKQVAGGCLTFILMMVVGVFIMDKGGLYTLVGLIAIIALFLVGALITGAFDD